MDPTVHELQLVCPSETPFRGNAWQNRVYLTLFEVNIKVLMAEKTDRL